MVGLRGFGGVLPWARRMIVEERRWLDEAEFTNLVSLCQLLPGPNIVNLSVALGRRFRGLPGSIAAFSGLMLAPFVIVVCLGMLYDRYGNLPHLTLVFSNVGAAAAGLVCAVACRMGRPHATRWKSILVAGAAFVAVALFRLELLPVVLVLAPASLLLHWLPRKSGP
jgi:chromate transporter